LPSHASIILLLVGFGMCIDASADMKYSHSRAPLVPVYGLVVGWHICMGALVGSPSVILTPMGPSLHLKRDGK